MTKNRQNSKNIVGEKQGISIYKYNPSVPDAIKPNQVKRTKIGGDRKGYIVNNNTGELSIGGASFYEFEEVDNTRFVKLFLEGIKQFSGLSKTAMELLEVIYRQLQDKHGKDTIILSHFIVNEAIKDMNERKYHRALRELLNKEIIFRSPADSLFFVNIRYMFNGDRLAFVKGYQREGTGKQKTLDLDYTESEK